MKYSWARPNRLPVASTAAFLVATMTVIQAVVLIVVTVVVGAAVLVATAAQLQVVEAGAAEVAAIALTVPTFVYEYEHRYLCAWYR